MFEWLKRLVARRELAELDELRREAHMLDRSRAENRQLREELRAHGLGPDAHALVVSSTWALPEWPTNFAAEWGARRHEWAQTCRWVPPEPERAAAPREQGIDYRFLGMTGEEDA